MKVKFTNAILIAASLMLTVNNAYSQFNPSTNDFSAMNTVINNEGNRSIDSVALSGITCNSENTFWAYGSNGIDEFLLNDTAVTFIANVVPPNVSILGNLTYCNNLNGGSYTPTFYASENYHNPAYFNGSGWTATSAYTPLYIINSGGNGNYLYYTGTDTSTIQWTTRAIVKYDGSALTIPYSWADTTKTLTVADLAVDSAGNVWFFTGVNNGTLFSDSLNVVSPSGQLLKQYFFSYNTLNAYGSFFTNGKLYIGLGSGNSLHPNSLIPITFNADSAIPGNPITMPANSYGDLAACTPGLATAIQKLSASYELRVYPNPSNNEFTISGITIGNGTAQVIVTDAAGKQIFVTSAPSSEMKISTQDFAAGIYFVQVKNQNCNSTKKLVIQH